MSKKDLENKFNELSAKRQKEPDEEIGIESLYRHYLMMNVNKKAMIITSRVHPGETQSSFALEGMVQFLLSD